MKGLNKRSLGKGTFLAAALFASGCPSPVAPNKDALVDILDIPGVEVPATGASPSATIPETLQYTGTVSWNSSGVFTAGMAYTATITLQPKRGFTFNGIAANTFRVSGANLVLHGANSGRVTAVFPATALATIADLSISGVSAPALGASPATAIDDTQYAGTVDWSPPVDGTFEADTVYTATIFLTPKKGYSFDGVAADSFTVDGAASVTHGANSGVVTVAFPSTSASVVTDAAISGVAQPVLGAAPVTTVEDTQYTGTVSWSPIAGASFAAATTYTATIILKPKSGWTFNGVAANSFTATGAVSVNHDANSGVVTAVFPATGSATITDLSIPGIIAPALGAVPVAAIDDTQFSGRVTWSPSVDGGFAPATTYTATITLTPKFGWTLNGVVANTLTVAGATSATHGANSGIVTAGFPATEKAIVTDLAILGLPAPVRGAAPVTIIDDAQYAGTVKWSPPVDGTFAVDTVYSATINLMPKTGFTLIGIAANSFTIDRAVSVTHGANSGTVTAVFPSTSASPITDFSLGEVAAPVYGAVPTTSFDGAEYAGAVKWNPAASGHFAAATIYTATISLSPKTGFTLNGVAANSFIVPGAVSVDHNANSGVVTAVYPITGLATVTDRSISGVAAPSPGAMPATSLDDTQYAGTVVWSPSVGGTFAAYTAYTATITLAPKSGWTFDGVPANSFTVAGAASVTHSSNSGVATAVFPATGAATVTDMAISGVTAPVLGETPVASIDDTQYTGSVSWSPTVYGTFRAVTTYSATITLKPKSGWSLNGVAFNAFTVPGAISVTHSEDSNVVKAVFPETKPATVSDLSISGLNVPIRGQPPSSAIDDTQYTGTVSWSPSVSGIFAAATTYTATIALTPRSGYTLNGVAANSFTVRGATSVTHGANSNIVTVVFPRTSAEKITDMLITGVVAPVLGATPIEGIDDTQYTGTVTWSPTVSGTFRASTTYTATIVLAPKTGFTLSGIAENNFWVDGASSTKHAANSGAVTVLFPATAPATVTDLSISGINIPFPGTKPVEHINDIQYWGSIRWSPSVARGFAAATTYTARIDLTTNSGWTLRGVAANSFTVPGATSVSHDAGSGVVTVVFPETVSETISHLSITGMKAPVFGNTPIMNIDQLQYAGTVSWYPSVGYSFADNTAYTATITLTPKTIWTLNGVAANSFIVAGATSVTHDANSGVVTAIFPPTDKRYSPTSHPVPEIRDWCSISSSSDGTKLAASTVFPGNVFTSTDSGATWTDHSTTGPRHIEHIASSSDGSKLAAVGDKYLYTSIDSGMTWNVGASFGYRQWRSISSSSDGVKLAVAVQPGYITTSIDSGLTWTERTTSGQRNWNNIASSSDGTKLAATDTNGFIYTSSDSGATWNERTASGRREWRSIATSSDGVKLVAGTGDGYLYTSVDSGATWTERTVPGRHSWNSVASSADGTRLAVVGTGNHVFTSTDSGETWIACASAGSRAWGSITCSADGSRLAAIDREGSIYTSADSGYTWTERTVFGPLWWNSIASSSDGTKLAAVAHQAIYISSDSGDSWVRRQFNRAFFIQIVSSSDGTKLAAISHHGEIYLSADSGASWKSQLLLDSAGKCSIAASSDGSKLVFIHSSGVVLTSSDSGTTWISRKVSVLQNLHSFTMSTDGAKLAAVVTNGYVYTSTDSGATWTERTASGSRIWTAITGSSDGTKLTAVELANGIYTSTDSGATWKGWSANRCFAPISSSADGSKLVGAPINGGNIYTSVNSGETWAEQKGCESRNWSSIACSSDGSKIVAVEGPGYIWVLE